MSSLNPLILSNVFALHNTSDISWYRFQERDPSSLRDELNNSSNNGRYSPGTTTNDPVLHCFLYCLQANYPACWRYVVHGDSSISSNVNSNMTPINAHSNTINSTTSTSATDANNTRKTRCTRELWVFNYNPGGAFMNVGKPLDEKDPDLARKQQPITFESAIQFLSSKLSVVSNGTWNSRARTTPLQVTKMLYLAFHNLIEKVMHQNSFLRIGECFVKRIKGEQRKNSIEAGLLGCSFTFFLTGDTLCFHVKVERVKVRNLLHSDLTTKEKVTVFTSPNSLVGTLIGGRFLDDSTSPASTSVLKEWSNIFHLRPALKSDDSFSHSDKFISSTAIVKVAFGNRQGFEMDFPAECVFRVTGDMRKDPTQILRTMYRRSLGLEVPKLKNMSYPDAAGFALLADYQWSEEDDDPNRHMQVDFWTYSSPFQYHTIQTVYQQRQQYLLQQQQQQQQLLLQKQQKVQDLRSPATAVKPYTPQQTPSASPMPSPALVHQDSDPTSPTLPEKDTGTQSENTESETATSQAEGKKKRAAAPPKRKREPATGRPPKKPKKAQSPAATPPPPAPEKKKPAAKKPKKAAAATTAGKGKRGKANQEAAVTPQLSQSSESTESLNQLSSSLPMMMTHNVTNPLPTAEAFGDAFDLSTRRTADEDMDELGGDIDISEWLNSASTAMAPAPGPAQSALSPSGGEFDKDLDFLSSPATTPALTAQKTPAMSPSVFPVVDDAVEIHFTGSKAYPIIAQPQYTPNSTNPTPSPQSPSPVSPSPISSPNISHSAYSLGNSQNDTSSGSATTPHTPLIAPPPPSFLSESHDSYLPLALRKNQSDQKRPRRFHTFLCAKSYQPLGESDLPAVSPRHLYSYTPQSKGPPLLDAISYTPEPFPVVPSTPTPSTPTSAIPTPLSNLTPNSVFTPNSFPNTAILDRKPVPRTSPFEEDGSDSESEESSDEDVKSDTSQELTLTTNPKPIKAEDTALRTVPDSLQYLKMWKVFREQNSTVAAAASSGSAAFSSLLPWDPMPDCLKCDSRSNASDSLQDALLSNARLEAWKLCHEKNAFLASNPDLCYVLEQLALSAYNAIPREGHRGAFSRLSLSICVGSLLNCQNAKGGFCVCDDHYELIEEGLQYYPFQSPHSPITYAADPASVGRMLFSLTPVFESLFGEKTIQGPLDLKHWFGSDSDTIFEAQESAPLLISYKDAWVAAPPDNCMRLWDKAQMEPYSSRKNLTYYVLCPQNATMSTAAASFFSDLSCVYEANHLGRHAAQNHYPEYPQGLIFVNAIPTPPTPAPAATPSESEETNPNSATSASRSAAFRDHREAYREACWRLGSHLRNWEQQYNENMNTVVYVIDPFTNTLESGAGSAAHEDNGQFMVRALADILAAQSKSSRRSTVLQIVPASELFLPTSDQAIALRELAFSVFTKIRRLSFTVPSSPSTSLRAQLSPNPNSLGSPPLLLSPPTPSTSTGQPSSSSTLRQEQQLYEPAFVLSNPPPIFSPGENVLHCCYIPADDLSCTACCVTDAKGELLETKLFSILPTTNLTSTHKHSDDPSLPSIQITSDPTGNNNNNNNNNNLYELILKFCISCIEWTSRNDWTIVISKLGILTFKEIEEWESFMNDVKPTLFKPSETGNLVTNVVLGCTHFNPRLQLLSITNPTDISSTSNEPVTGSTVEALASSGTTSYLVFPPRPVSHYSHHMIATDCAIPLASSYVVTEAASDKGAAPGAFTPRSADSDNRGDKWPKTYMVYLFGLYTKTRNLSALEHNRPSPPTQTKQRVQQTQEIHNLIRGMTRQYVALSWLNVTPLFPSRLSILPHHCAIAFRLARLVAIVDSREDKEEKETTTPPLVQSFPTSPTPTTPSHTPHTPSHAPPPSPHVPPTSFHPPAVPYMFPLTSDS